MYKKRVWRERERVKSEERVKIWYSIEIWLVSLNDDKVEPQDKVEEESVEEGVSEAGIDECMDHRVTFRL